MPRNVFELAKAEREKREKLRRDQASVTGPARNKKLAADMANAKLSTSEWVTVQEAARRLRLSRDGADALISTGLLRSRKLAGRRLVEVASLEVEWNRRNVRLSKDRSQHPHSKPEQPPTVDSESKVEFKIRRGMQIVGRTWVDYDNEDVWAPACRARKVIGLNEDSLTHMALTGKIRRRWAHRKTLQEVENPMGPNGKRVRGPWAMAMFSMKDLNRIASARESKEWARCSSPNDPERSVRRSYIRTILEAPPGDALITRAQAADILKVATTRITDLVKKGVLFGWQAQPGKSGCPLYLSWNQVNRYAQNPERLAQRAMWEQSRGKPSPRTPTHNQKEFAYEHGLSLDSERALKRGHGEYYTATQAANILNVSRSTLRGLRKRGRLKGYRSPNSREKFNRRRFWFFKKDDVDALKIDSDYRRRSKIYWKTRMPWAFGDEAFAIPNNDNWHPHEFDHSPSPAAKMKMEMENW